MHYGRSNIGYGYSKDSQPVAAVDCEKDLGVTFSQDLKAAAHCKQAYSEANCMLGLISRTIRYRNTVSLMNLY